MAKGELISVAATGANVVIASRKSDACEQAHHP